MLQLFRRYPQVLLFGILTALFSGPGQTFLVSLFIPYMRDEFGMSQTEIASLYAVATMASAFLLPWIGRLIDRLQLLWMSLVAGFLLACGCLVLSRSTGVWSVLIGFLLVRNLGQGTLTMLSSTTMARVFGKYRGKALAIANIGYPISEAFFPFLVTTWILAHGWRSGWDLLAALTIIFFAPAMLLLIRKNPHEDAHAELNESSVKTEEKKHGLVRDYTIREMLKDPRFYFMIIPLLMAPAFLTGLFFHQVTLVVEWKGWTLKILSAAFVVYALFRVMTSFLSGYLVDRYSAKKLFPITLVPLLISAACLFVGNHIVWCFIYLTFAGISMGFAFTVTGALYAEFYGTKHLGAIKGLISALIVLSTAVAPPLMGVLLDASVDPSYILLGMVSLMSLGVLSAWKACSS